MCILCVIQKWSRRIATMLPWLVIPLIALWALSQLLPPAFRFEITSPRLACVFVLLITLFWYEILMPQLSAWRVRRNARLRERKRFEAIEMQKLRKTATRRCRNCLTPYREQNPGGGKFMCSYCGHISKRPVLDLPVPPGLGLPNSGILKDLIGKSGKILNGKVWADNSSLCSQDWLENGHWVAGSFSGKPVQWRKNGDTFFGGDDHCLAEKSYSRILIFACRALAALFLSIMRLLRKIFRVSTSSDDASVGAEHRMMMGKRGENGTNFPESRGEKARRKAEEKRQARLEKEQLEEEERKQREEVARLVEERRRLRDEKIEAEKDRRKRLTPARENDNKKETEKKRQERKKERDHVSSKSNSDAEELEKRAGKEGKCRKSESDYREHHRTAAEGVKSYNTDTGNGMKGAPSNNHTRGNTGTRYLDRMRGTFLSSSRAFTGSSFFGKGVSASPTIARDQKSNGIIGHVHTSSNRREVSDRVSGKVNIAGEDKNIKRTVLLEPQPFVDAPKKSWQQLFTRSATVPPPSNSNVISRPNGKSQVEPDNPPVSSHQVATQQYDNPINFGLPSPFPLSALPYGSTSSNIGNESPSESMFSSNRAASPETLPEEPDIFEDPCYIPDAVALLGPVSESLENFQLDLGFVTDIEKPRPTKSIPASSEILRPSPIESPLSRSRVSEEKYACTFSSPKAQEVGNMPIDDLSNANEKGTWQMWNTSPLGQDGLGLVGGVASWLLPPELNRSNKEDSLHTLPPKTMASLFKKDDQVLSSTHPQQKVLFGSYQSGGNYSTSFSGSTDRSWLPETLFGPKSSGEDHFSQHAKEKSIQNEMSYGSPNRSTTRHPFEPSFANHWPKLEWTAQGASENCGNSSITRPPVGGLYFNPDVQSLWSYD